MLQRLPVWDSELMMFQMPASRFTSPIWARSGEGAWPFIDTCIATNVAGERIGPRTVQPSLAHMNMRQSMNGGSLLMIYHDTVLPP